jgi:thiosulfate/3-mercaptopyruvate sulfurtransferase
VVPVADALIEPGELVGLLSEGSPVVLADVRWNLNGPPACPEYEAAHLPGAHWVDLEQELAAPPGLGGRHPLPARHVFEQAMRRVGVSAGTLVVGYDAATSLSAARLWWLLRDSGHDRVRVLNGGLAAWRSAGLPVETGPGPSTKPGDFHARPGHLRRVSADELAAAITGAPAPVLVDVRAHERFTGDAEPIDPVAGHIPGAMNLPSMDSVGADGRFASAAELAARYSGVGPSPVVYCGSGITSAHTLLAMTVGGRSDGIMYPGSWSEWITDPHRPVATGAG